MFEISKGELQGSNVIINFKSLQNAVNELVNAFEDHIPDYLMFEYQPHETGDHCLIIYDKKLEKFYIATRWYEIDPK